jgi:PKD repeat protein
MKRLSYLSLLLFILTSTISYSQLDNEFWFVAPAVTENHSGNGGCTCTQNNRCGASPVSFNFTNTNDNDAVIEITQPANEYDAFFNPSGFQPITITVPANSFHTETLWGNNPCDPTFAAMRELIENRFDPFNPAGVMQKGIRITSSEYITAYYEVEERNNSDIYSLKGRNALGDLFYCSFQTNERNHPFLTAGQQPARSSIDIVAVDAGVTRVWVYPTNPVVGFGQPDSFAVDLNQGETVTLVAGVDNGGGNITYNLNGNQHLHGTKLRVEGKKRIAVTLSDDSVHGDSGCYDLLGDQTVPLRAVSETGEENVIIDTDYIVMKGSLGWDRGGGPDLDRIYILATEDGTNVTVEDLTAATTNTYNGLSEQQQVVHEVPYEAGTGLIYVSANKPIYVLHVSGAEGGCELGQSIIPTISQCTGSFDVGFSRGAQSASKTFLMNIMVLGDTLNPSIDSSIYFFEFNGNPKPNWSTLFTRVTGTNWWATQIDFTDSVAEHSRNILSNSRNIFHLGTLNGGRSNGGNYGYFSNYSRIQADGVISGVNTEATKLCYGQTVQLEAYGGLSYNWFPSTFLSDSTVQTPYATPFSDIQYGVIVSGASCSLADTAYVELLVSGEVTADYSMEKYHGCSEFTIKPVNTSSGNLTNRWYINDIYQTNKATPDSFVLSNTTDTIVDYRLKLVTWNKFCPAYVERLVRVFPEIRAGFEVDTIIGCHPIEINFTDTSTMAVDSATYEWNFGDLAYSNEQNPSHVFENIGAEDTTYTVKMLITSKYVCRDSAFANITVHPLVEARLAIDTALSCSPLATDLNPLNAIGVDTFFYSVSHQYATDYYTLDNYNPVNITHTDTSVISPDTLKVDLVAMNRMGCTDTLDQRRIIVYPQVIAQMQLDTNVICDSLSIRFDNASTGYNLKYEWDFGDGSNAIDSVGNSYFHYFMNRGSNIDKEVIISLEANSEYFCSDITFDTITVHPFVQSKFTLDFDGNCSPLDVELQNNSVGLNSYDIIWGDGTDNLGLPSLTEDLHRFTNPDPVNNTTYTIKLIAEHNVGGCSDSITKDVTLFPLVSAGFNTIDSVGCNPLNVSFTNTSQGTGLNYTWDFGDGAGTDTSVAAFDRLFHNYTSTDRTYNVNLYVSNGFGCDSSITKQVEVFSYIDALFTIQNVDSCSPFPLQIQNSSPDGVAFYQWDFDDGSPLSTLKVPEHTYRNTSNTTQTRDVRLVVNNTHAECADTAYQTVEVRPEILASYATDVAEGCQPLEVNITNNSSIITGTDFSWDFGDTTYYFGATPPAHYFQNINSNEIIRDITLRAVSEHYCYDDTTMSFRIYPLIEARFAIDVPEICSGDMFTIDPSASRGAIDRFEWNTDEVPGADNLLASADPFSFTYTNTDVLTDDILIELVTSNSYNCTDTATENILVRPGVNADFSITPDEDCYPFIATITNNTPQGAHQAQIFEWELGDGSTSNATDLSFTHFYENLSNTHDSVYIINLFTKSIFNCSDSLRDTITIHPKPKSNFVFSEAIKCPPFSPLITNGSIGSNLTYSWSFPNGTPSNSNAFEPLVEFLNDGNSILTNNVQLITNTEFGCADTIVNKLRVYPSVQNSIAVTPESACHPMYANFTGSNAENAFQFEWMIDGETFSIEEQPASIMLGNETDTDKEVEIVFYGESVNECKDWDTVMLTIFPTPNVDFIPEPLTQDYDISDDATTFDFRNITLYREAWDYEWDFADDNSSTDASELVSHTYGNEFWGDVENDNKLFLNLYAYNPNHPECNDEIERFIVINPPQPLINIGEEIELCANDTLSLEASYRYVYDNSFLWDFGDGRTINDVDPEYVIYDSPGRYIIKLEVEGDGGTNWDFKEITVHETPLVDFDYYPDVAQAAGVGELPDTVYFRNLTKYGEQFVWTFYPIYENGDFGPAVTDTSEHPRRVFDIEKPNEDNPVDSTFYAIELLAINVISPSLQCVDSVFKELTLKWFRADYWNFRMLWFWIARTRW